MSQNDHYNKAIARRQRNKKCLLLLLWQTIPLKLFPHEIIKSVFNFIERRLGQWKTPRRSFGMNPGHGIKQQKRLTYQYWQPGCSLQIVLTDFKFHWICVCHCCFRTVAGTFEINNDTPPPPPLHTFMWYKYLKISPLNDDKHRAELMPMFQLESLLSHIQMQQKQKKSHTRKGIKHGASQWSFCSVCFL